MIAKVIAYGPDRATALARLDRALAHTAILGLTTNVGFLRALIGRDDVRAGEMDTGLIGRMDPVAPPLSDEQVARAYATHALGEPADDDPFSRRDGWRLGGVRAPSYWKLSVDGGELDLARPSPLEPARRNRYEGSDPFIFAGGWVGYEGWAWHVTEPTAEDVHHAHGDGELRAPMPGSVLLVPVAVGDAVEAGQTVVVLESMKMELALTAPVDGTVTELTVSVGDKVGRDETVARVGMTTDEFRANTADHEALVADLRAQLERVRLGRRGEGPRAAHVARQAAPARARRPAAGQGRAVPGALAAGRARHVRRRRAGRGDRHRRRARERARVRDRRQRRDRQGRHLLPDDGQEAPARAGGRAAEPAAVHLPRRLRRRVPAAAGRGLPRPRALRPDLLQPGDDVPARHPADRGGHGLLHRRRRLRARDERRVRDRARAGHDLPRRPAAGEGRDGRGGRARRTSAAATCTRARRGVTDHLADDDEHALEIVRTIVATLPKNPRGVGARAGRAARARPGLDLRRRPRRRAQALRPARADRAARRRQPLPRVQGALRHDARVRLRAPARPPGRDPGQQRHPVQRVRPQGRALHRALRPPQDPARLPAEHQRLHGRARVRGGRHRQARREDGHRGVAARACRS